MRQRLGTGGEEVMKLFYLDFWANAMYDSSSYGGETASWMGLLDEWGGMDGSPLDGLI